MHVQQTDEPVKDVEIVKTVKGKLKFKDEEPELKASKYFLTDVELQDKIKNKEEKKKRDYPSCWIDLSGKEYIVGFTGHNEFASEWLHANGWTLEDKRKAKGYGRYDYEILENEGWVRILGWTDPPTFSLPSKLTPKQRKAIKDYCQSNACDLPKDL